MSKEISETTKKEKRSRKYRMVKLLEILERETDEDHHLTTKELIEKLDAFGAKCERQTIYSDYKFLNANGYEIIVERVGKDNTYFLASRKFTTSELKILIDSVQAAKFITPNKADALIQKISSLNGAVTEEHLKKSQICFNTVHHSNEHIYYIIEAAEQAITQHKRLAFYYFDLDENHKQIRRKEERYISDPVALIFNEDNYYLMCYSKKYQNTANYRIDRMDSPIILDENVDEKAIIKSDSISTYSEEVFKMFGGEMIEITLEFDDSLINMIFDKFGDDTKIKRLTDTRCQTTVRIQEAPTFWGWIFTFGKQMKITAPENMVNLYQQKVTELLQNN